MSVEAKSAAPTIYDVARAAGVSIASVSRVLNGRRNPSPEIRDRVRRAVAELGETAFEVLYSMISREAPAERDIALPTRLMCRESCGCQAGGGRLDGVTDLSSVRQLRS